MSTQDAIASAANPPPSDTDALVERLFGAAIDTLEIASVHIGGRLGLYRALVDGGDATPGELAARTGTAERYLREWLEQQAVAGLLSVDDASGEAGERRYGLPETHRPVLVDEEDLNYLTPLASLAIGVCGPMEALLAAYRTGDGVPFAAYDIHDAIGDINRPQYVSLVADWLGSIPEVDARLRAQPPARVADLACGTAWSSIAIARAYAEVLVDAIDEDAASIDTARANVATAGLSDRVRPAVQDASDPQLAGRYDLVTIFEALHDMNHPVEALRAARRLLSGGGSVVIADERVAERFTAPGGRDRAPQLRFQRAALPGRRQPRRGLRRDRHGDPAGHRARLRGRGRLRPRRRVADRARFLALLPAPALRTWTTEGAARPATPRTGSFGTACERQPCLIHY